MLLPPLPPKKCGAGDRRGETPRNEVGDKGNTIILVIIYQNSSTHFTVFHGHNTGERALKSSGTVQVNHSTMRQHKVIKVTRGTHKDSRMHPTRTPNSLCPRPSAHLPTTLAPCLPSLDHVIMFTQEERDKNNRLCNTTRQMTRLLRHTQTQNKH